jgi:putative inorganic carbon (HCO3(-)) transporter
MSRSLYLDNRGQALTVLGGGLMLALAFGLIAGRWPVAALGGVLAIALAVVMLKDLAVAIIIFTAVSFATVLSLGGAATGAKALGGLLVLSWLAALAKQPRQQVRGLLRDHRGLVACAVALVAWSILSAVWAQSSSAAVLGASRYAQDLVLFPIMYAGVRRFAHVRWIVVAFVVGALLATLYGVATGTTVDSSRLVGAIGDPNETATVLVMASVLALALGIGETRSSVRRWLAFAAAIAAIFGMVATASRGGIVAMAATAVVAVVIAGRWRRQIAMAGAVGALLVVGWFTLLAPTSAREHISTTQTPRTTLWTVAGRAIAANPVVGVGNDNFSVSAKNYLLQPGVTTRADQVVVKQDVAHNIYLEVWADTGVVGLALFLAVVLVPLRSLWKAVRIFERADRRTEEILARALIVAIAALLAAGFFISDEYSKHLFLLLGLAIAMPRVARAETQSVPA